MEGVYKVYSGKAGHCACGCSGKYSYTADGAVNHNPGYDVSDKVNERSVKIIAGKVMRDPNRIDEGGFSYVVKNNKILVAYFAK